jgi:hypothetical protein
VSTKPGAGQFRYRLLGEEPVCGWVRGMKTLGRSVAPHWPKVLAVVVLAYATWVNVRYAGQRIVETDHFRQTETALTAYWMVRQGWQLAYQTPGWGYPWSAPIEFPIYQALVALIVRMSGLPLEPVGRLVSFAFLIGCAWPAFMLGRRLKMPSEAAWVFCALLWSSPLYLVWGRTFMIETAALFFTLAAIPYLLDLRYPNASLQSAVLAAFWGTLGMLQRSVAAGPTLLVLGVVVLVSVLRASRASESLRRIALLALGIGLPLAIGVIWTAYSDLIKSHNFVGQELTLRFRLSHRYVGTLAQRFNLGDLKEIFWNRMLAQNAAGFIGVALLAGVLLSRQCPVRTFVWVCLILTALPVILFFDVSLLLDYYQVPSVVFLIAALTLSCVVWLPKVIRWRGIVPMTATVLVMTNVFVFWSRYGSMIRFEPNETNWRGLAVSDVVRRYTPEDSGILVLGIHKGLASFCPEIPYFSQRKGLTVPDWKEHLIENDPLPFLGGKRLGAMVFCSVANKDRYNHLIARLSDTSAPRLFRVSECYVWLPDTRVVVLPDGTSVLPTQFLQ